MATTASNKDAAKVAKLREMAKDKSLPQDVRNTYLDQAVKLEEKAAKDAGVKLAKGGMPVRGERTATNKAKKMMYGGMAEKTKMAVGGMLPPPPMPRKGGTPPAPTSKPSMKNQIAKATAPKFTAVSRKMAVGGAVQMTREEQMAKMALEAQAGPVQKPSQAPTPVSPSMMRPSPMLTNKAKKPAGRSGKPMMYGVMADKKPMMAKGGAVKKAKK